MEVLVKNIWVLRFQVEQTDVREAPLDPSSLVRRRPWTQKTPKSNNVPTFCGSTPKGCDLMPVQVTVVKWRHEQYLSTIACMQSIIAPNNNIIYAGGGEPERIGGTLGIFPSCQKYIFET